MKIGIDSNVLVSAHMPGLPQHARARQFLLDRLAEAETILVLTPDTLGEFLHVIADPRRFEPPAEMSAALALARGYLGRSNTECITPDETAFALTLDWMDRFGLGRRRIRDTLLAATLLSGGVSQLATFNRRDFDIFEGLTVLDPRD